MIGPTAQEGEYSAITTLEGLSEVRERAQEILKNIPFNKNIRVFSGVRTTCGPDFIIEKSKLKPNLINIAGIDSPGLTAAPAIAEYVAKLLELKNIEKHMIKRKAYTDINTLNDEQLNELIKKDPDYGKIVCRCENVTLGQVKEALNSPLKPRTIDAVKRRVRPGMGRCQGGFCFLKVAQVIAETYNIKLEEVCKEEPGSTFIVSDIKGGTL
jgi:glycerol-3-phosphate dehydrogenase